MNLILLQGSGPVPASGFMLCFIPLAAIVLGLIAFFVVTDRHASRPYLRFNPFVAANSTAEELAARPPAVGETPAGGLGAPAGKVTVSLGQYGEKVTVPEEAAPPPAAPDVPASFAGAPASSVPKDFGAVEGINLPKVDQEPEAAAAGARITTVMYNPEGVDQAGEYVRIENNSGAPLDMTGWTLQDRADQHVFTFPAFVLASGAAVMLWTRAGTNDAENLFWGSRGAIWNNAGDTAILRDASGNVVSRFSYEGTK